jgi:mannose-6-phosphate isomerase-like protein (cupin superfamily)
MRDRLFIHERDLTEQPDICGGALDLINSEVSKATRLSLATIFIEPGRSSQLHYHKMMEEIYYFIEGAGIVTVGSETFEVSPGAAVFIPIGELHQVKNHSDQRLKFISADSPSFDVTDIYFPD